MGAGIEREWCFGVHVIPNGLKLCKATHIPHFHCSPTALHIEGESGVYPPHVIRTLNACNPQSVTITNSASTSTVLVGVRFWRVFGGKTSFGDG